LYVIDRGADDFKVLKFFSEEKEKFLIRMKKNRNFLNMKNGKITKITSFKEGNHNVQINDIPFILHVYKKP
jgi:hypothetical protein